MGVCELSKDGRKGEIERRARRLKKCRQSSVLGLGAGGQNRDRECSSDLSLGTTGLLAPVTLVYRGGECVLSGGIPGGKGEGVVFPPSAQFLSAPAACFVSAEPGSRDVIW